MSPTISIVTPSLNQGRFLDETIRSVISQEGDFTIDYVIVDGGSSDDSPDIIRKYDALVAGRKWPLRCRGIKYRWISEKDRGQSHAINKGLAMAGGEIVAWLNSDDYYVAGAFSTACKAFAGDESLGMLYGDGYAADRNGFSSNRYGVEPFFDLWKLIHLYDFILQPSVFMRKSALEKAGPVNEELAYIMDWELWIRLSRFGRVLYCPEDLSYARIYPEAKTSSAGMKRWKEIAWCSRKYGNMRWPPVLFTQLFHKPLQLMTGNGKGGGTLSSPLVKAMTKTYYALIGGNKSGIYAGGYVEKTSFLSIPVRDDIAKIIIAIQPLCRNNIRYYINGLHSGSLRVEDRPVSLEVTIGEQIRKAPFLHIKFESEKVVEADLSSAGISQGKFAFRMRDVLAVNAKAEEIKDAGLPEFNSPALLGI